MKVKGVELLYYIDTSGPRQARKPTERRLAALSIYGAAKAYDITRQPRPTLGLFYYPTVNPGSTG